MPPTWRGEVTDGELFAFPRPAGLHADIEASVTADLEAGRWVELGIFGAEQAIRAACAFKRYQDHRRYLALERDYVARALGRTVP